MDYYSTKITALIEELSRLPGIGPKSAGRLAFHLLNLPETDVNRLTGAILDAKHNVRYCRECCTLTDGELCPICASPARDHSQIMVVENTRDLAAYEKTGKFNGVYHVLHGQDVVEHSVSVEKTTDICDIAIAILIFRTITNRRH